MMIVNSLLEAKWQKFRRRAKLFRYIPFVEFALAAGSMAMGTPRENSDFDVIVGARSGRIFTARFFSIVFFRLFGWARKAAHDKDADPKSVRDKICLSHFVTEGGYRLKPPHTDYRHRLYRVLVPLVGREDQIKNFFAGNDWLEPPREWIPDEEFITLRRPIFRTLVEKLLFGKLGDRVEEKLKEIQVSRIIRGADSKPSRKPRIICTDNEIELYHHTERGD